METSTVLLPDVPRGHVNRINQALAAGEDTQAFYLAYEYFRAGVQKLRKSSAKKRQRDADGFVRQAAYLLAYLANETYFSHPGEDFRFGLRLVPGGDWQPEGVRR